MDISNIKLGKRPARVDERTIKYAKVRVPLEVLAPPPATFDVQDSLGISDTDMFLNDQYGDCVVAAAYHLLEVFSKQECGQVIRPTSDEVKNLYFALTGGQDTGLVELDFLNYWRQTGIPAQGKLYKIYAFTSIDWKNHAEVCDAIYYLKNVYSGVALPRSAQSQYANNQIWDVTSGPDAEPGSWGGHAMYGPAYLLITGVNETGPVFETWGKRQQATWAWWDKYVDELYAIVPAQNITNSPIDPIKLDQILAEITSDPVPPDPPAPPKPGKCSIFGLKAKFKMERMK